MSLFQRLRRKLSLAEPEAWALFAGGSHAGKPVNEESALTVSAAWACIRLISETVATLPLGIFSRAADGGREAASDHPLYEILHNSPNADQTAVEFWEGEVAKVCLVGNAISYREEGSGGRLISLEPLTEVFWGLTPDGQLIYRFNDRGRYEEVPESKVFHIKGFGNRRYHGLSPIHYARHTLGASMAADETAAKYLGNGLQVSGFIETPHILDDKNGQRAQWEETLAKFTGSSNAGKLMTLEGGFKFVPMTMPGKDAELLSSRKFNVEEVCRWYHVPPIMIGHAAEGQTMWGSGVEQIMIAWLQTGLRAYLKRIEAAVHKRLIPPGEKKRFYAEYNIDGLLRADSAARAALYSSFAQNGVMSRNEIRAKENLSPMPGGDQLTVQSNLVPLDKLAASTPAVVKLRAALREVLSENGSEGDAA